MRKLKENMVVEDYGLLPYDAVSCEWFLPLRRTRVPSFSGGQTVQENLEETIARTSRIIVELNKDLLSDSFVVTLFFFFFFFFFFFALR